MEAAVSWLEIPSNCDFSIDNIPFGVCSFPNRKVVKNSANNDGNERRRSNNNNDASSVCNYEYLSPCTPRCCTAIGKYVVDLALLAQAGLFDDLTSTTTTNNYNSKSSSSAAATTYNIHGQDRNEEESININSSIVASFHPRHVFSQPNLNEFMSCPKQTWVDVRNRLICLFLKCEVVRRDDHNILLVPDPRLHMNSALQNQALYLHSEARYHLPARIGDYTDFYSSREHATNVGIMFRGRDHALQPNWLHMPIGYHGRSSSIFPSVACAVVGDDDDDDDDEGTAKDDACGDGNDDTLRMSSIRRPCGQMQLDPSDPTKGSRYGPCKLLDFELEVAFFVGGQTNYDVHSGENNNIMGGELKNGGRPLTFQQAKDRIFGYVLMNDWSARDIQKWEYIPLGPFTSKNFATTISTWIVTPMALEPYCCETSSGRTQGGSSGEGWDPKPLDYLQDDDYGSYDVNLSVSLRTQGSSSSSSGRAQIICQSNLRNMYWTSTQQLVHHSVTGCPMNAGDLLASGTISGTHPNSFGSMLELSWNGTRDIVLSNGEVRKFLQDGDTVIIEGSCASKEGWGRVGFGQCSGKVLPAIPYPYAEYYCNEENVTSKIEPQPKYFKFEVRGFMRSSCTWRIRMALIAKGIKHELILQEVPSCQGELMNASPFLEFSDGGRFRVRITQFLAIIEFLESAFPYQGVSLLPSEPVARAKVVEVAEIVLSRRLEFRTEAGVDCRGTINKDHEENDRNVTFAINNIKVGLEEFEDIVVPFHTVSQNGRRRSGTSIVSIGGPYAMGTHGPTLVDICLVTQLFDARQLGIDISNYPTLKKIHDACTNDCWLGSAIYPE